MVSLLVGMIRHILVIINKSIILLDHFTNTNSLENLFNFAAIKPIKQKVANGTKKVKTLLCTVSTNKDVRRINQLTVRKYDRSPYGRTHSD